MILRTTGTVLGVRSEDYTIKATGEMRTRRTLDLYDPEDGPAELDLREGVESPAAGSQVVVKVGVRAYSGYVRDGAAGDARVIFSALDVQPVDPALKSVPPRERKQA